MKYLFLLLCTSINESVSRNTNKYNNDDTFDIYDDDNNVYYDSSENYDDEDYEEEKQNKSSLKNVFIIIFFFIIVALLIYNFVDDPVDTIFKTNVFKNTESDKKKEESPEYITLKQTLSLEYSIFDHCMEQLKNQKATTKELLFFYEYFKFQPFEKQNTIKPEQELICYFEPPFYSYDIHAEGTGGDYDLHHNSWLTNNQTFIDQIINILNASSIIKLAKIANLKELKEGEEGEETKYKDLDRVHSVYKLSINNNMPSLKGKKLYSINVQNNGDGNNCSLCSYTSGLVSNIIQLQLNTNWEVVQLYAHNLQILSLWLAKIIKHIKTNINNENIIKILATIRFYKAQDALENHLEQGLPEVNSTQMATLESAVNDILLLKEINLTTVKQQMPKDMNEIFHIISEIYNNIKQLCRIDEDQNFFPKEKIQEYYDTIFQDHFNKAYILRESITQYKNTYKESKKIKEDAKIDVESLTETDRIDFNNIQILVAKKAKIKKNKLVKTIKEYVANNHQGEELSRQWSELIVNACNKKATDIKISLLPVMPSIKYYAVKTQTSIKDEADDSFTIATTAKDNKKTYAEILKEKQTVATEVYIKYLQPSPYSVRTLHYHNHFINNNIIATADPNNEIKITATLTLIQWWKEKFKHIRKSGVFQPCDSYMEVFVSNPLSIWGYGKNNMIKNKNITNEEKKKILEKYQYISSEIKN